MMKRAAFLTLGCKVNQYETDAMEGMMEDAGYEIVDFTDTADVYIINTCSVTNMADRKSRQMINRARKKNPHACIVAAGCYVQSAGEKLREMGIADVLVGNNKKKDLVEIIEDWNRKQTEVCEIIEIGKTHEYEELRVDHLSDHTRAYLKIEDGCNQFCSYCIIPYTRGRIRSRDPEAVNSEVRKLADKGYKEIVLTGIHLGSYGLDLEEIGLIDIIEQLNRIEGIERIRLGSLEPRIITEDFMRRLYQCSKVCPHFHLSLQSGCDATLKRMNRKYTAAEYEEALSLIRKVYDRPALCTDVIVGFVGESEEEFAKTVEYLERIQLYEMHIFKYSVRAGTRAASMEGHVNESLKNDRSAVLLAMTEKHKMDYMDDFIGEEVQVLMEEKVAIDGKEYYTGYTERYVRVAVPIKGQENLYNEIVRVRLIGRLNQDHLLGEIG